MPLFNGAEGVARAFNLILSKRCTVTSQSQDNVFLAGSTDVCEDQVEDGCTNAWMREADLL